MKKLFTYFIFLVIGCTYAQTLLKIQDREINTQYFENQYKNNIEFEGLENALESFIDFELLYQDALNLKIDTATNFKERLSKTKSLFRTNYVLERPEMKSLIERDFYQSNTDREIEFIVVRIDDEKSKTKAKDLANQLFKEYTQGKSIKNILRDTNRPEKINGSHQYFIRKYLGNPEFEKHFFDVELKKKLAPQELLDGYVFGMALNDSPVKELIAIRAIIINDSIKHVKNRIDSAFSDLKNNLTFENVLNKYCNKTSIQKAKGWLRFNGNNIPIEIKKVVDTLKSEEFSKPVKIDDNWYIFKVIKKPNCFEIEKCYDTFLTRQIKHGLLGEAKEQFYENYLRYKVSPIIVKENLTDFLSEIDNDYFTNSDSLKVPEKKVLMRFNGESIFNTQDLSTVLNNLPKTTSKDSMKQLIELYLKNQIINFSLNEYKKNLTQYEPEYSLLWEAKKRDFYFSYYNTYLNAKAKEDSIGHRKFYKKTNQKYFVDQRVSGELFICLTESLANTVKQLIKEGKNFDYIIQKYAGQTDDLNRVLVTGSFGDFFSNDNRFPTKFDANKTIQLYKKNGKFFVLKVNEIIPKGVLPFNKVQPQVIENYTNYFTSEHLKTLKKSIQYNLIQENVNLLKSKYAN